MEQLPTNNQEQRTKNMASISDLPPISGGAYAKWESPGAKVTGHILSVSGDGTKIDGTPCPLLVIDTGAGVVNVSCSQWDLDTKVRAEDKAGRLVPGRRIAIEFTGVEARPGGKTKKVFSLKTADGAAGYKPPAPEAFGDDEEPF